ncbi:MAG TPA: SDR family oxidoreductase [Acidimicrobiia bacterium]|nr:SDR family oxidoreductase [Acidimicrobiia bacterium]
MLNLDGRTAVVTGGASGIGAAVCTALQKEGVRVASLDLQPGGPADLTYECDVSDEASVAQAVAAAAADLGGVDYAFVNAGIAGMGSVLTMPMEEWDRVVAVNFRGAFMTLQHAARAIKATGRGGAIVVTASSAAIVADMGFVHYSMAKIGVSHMTRVAARELGPFGIRVNAIAPGPTRTPMFEGAEAIPDFADAVISRTPLGRLGEAEDIAEAVLALLALRWVTGQTLAADGGVTLAAGTDMPGLTGETLAQW